MEKECYHSNGKISNSKRILTGVAKVTTCVALSGLIVGSMGLRLASLGCGANHSVDAICPMARLESFLFGEEAGLNHQAEDLRRYNLVYPDYKEYTQNVKYVPAGTYVVPEGYELRYDEDGSVYGYREVPVITTTFINEFGEEQNAYTLQNGGIIGKDKDGNMYGYQKVEPMYVENGTIYYTVVSDYGNQIITKDELWSYADGEYIKSAEAEQTLRKTR